MIVRIGKSGTSFLSAGKYYLHDKLSEQLAMAAQSGVRVSMRDQTDDRVWFTDTRNCLNIDPERALEEMWRTAEDQAYLKLQAGVKLGGRPCTEPVKTLSLSWHKDDRPDPQHMVEAANSFLKHMGWEKHQAVYVGHNDTEHRHIHIILNRVNPEDGRTLDDYQDKKRAQVWALAYEKEHENLRCEVRELRAATRERRAPELNPSQQSEFAQHQQKPPAPANDHLPHNVILITRPYERALSADDQARQQAYDQVRDLLKAEQRAEREAFFKEGRKVFKATRHQIYDEVRKEYAPEWKSFYKEGAKTWAEAEQTSQSAIGRALHFAKHGKLEAARDAFDDRMSVQSAVAKDLVTRKGELKARQMQDLRERQREACDALRAERDLHYKELLQRQRDERAALLAHHALGGHDPMQALVALGLDRTSQAPATNENPPVASTPGKALEPSLAPSALQMPAAVLTEAGGSIELSPMVPIKSDGPAPSRGLSDLAAGGIGGAASYLADQLGEFFAPTPPEVREAQAKESAKRADKAPAIDKTYDKIIDSALQLVEEERARKADAYWKERDRGKGWERDQ